MEKTADKVTDGSYARQLCAALDEKDYSKAMVSTSRVIKLVVKN